MSAGTIFTVLESWVIECAWVNTDWDSIDFSSFFWIVTTDISTDIESLDIADNFSWLTAEFSSWEASALDITPLVSATALEAGNEIVTAVLGRLGAHNIAAFSSWVPDLVVLWVAAVFSSINTSFVGAEVWIS